MSVLSVVCCHVEVSPSELSFLQGSPIKYGVSECDREVSTMRRPRPIGGGGAAIAPW